PSGPLIAVAATVLGFGLGAGIVFLKVSTDRTIRTPKQAISLVGADCLGLIPRIRNRFFARFKDSTLRTYPLLSRVQEPPSSILCHAIRRVGAAALEPSNQGMRSLGVTAALPGEGTTTVAQNLALVAANAGRKVLLVDGVSSDPRLS